MPEQPSLPSQFHFTQMFLSRWDKQHERGSWDHLSADDVHRKLYSDTFFNLLELIVPKENKQKQRELIDLANGLAQEYSACFRPERPMRTRASDILQIIVVGFEVGSGGLESEVYQIAERCYAALTEHEIFVAGEQTREMVEELLAEGARLKLKGAM